MNKALGFLSLMTLAALSACALPPAPPPRGAAVQQQPAGTTPMQMTLTGTYWRLAAFRTQVELVELSEPNNGAIQFAANGNVAGNSGCNTFMGNYETMDNNIIKIAPAGMTMMACENDLMMQESAVMDALPLARTYKITGTGAATVRWLECRVVALQRRPAGGAHRRELGCHHDQQWQGCCVVIGRRLCSRRHVRRRRARCRGKGGCNNYNGAFTGGWRQHQDRSGCIDDDDVRRGRDRNRKRPTSTRCRTALPTPFAATRWNCALPMARCKCRLCWLNKCWAEPVNHAA